MSLRVLISGVQAASASFSCDSRCDSGCVLAVMLCCDSGVIRACPRRFCAQITAF